jgi:hypothetical protein
MPQGDNRVQGFSGCYRLMGSYDLKGKNKVWAYGIDTQGLP